MWKKYRGFLLGVLLGALGMSGILAAHAGDNMGDLLPFAPQNLALLKQARNIIETYYVDANKGPGEKKFLYGSLHGLVSAVGDPYTRFAEPDQLKNERIEMEGEYGGLGIYIGHKDGKTLVISPIEGTPADVAGLKPMDEIVRIDDQMVFGMDQNEIVNRLRGTPGTKVSIWIRRQGHEQLLRFDLVRKVIKLKSVRLEMFRGPIAYVRLTQFTEKTGPELDAALKKVKAAKARGLVLDLRNNPGGLLSTAVDVASDFLDGGLVVGMRGRVDRANDTLYAERGKALSLPMVVLINEGSASASEIVAGALKDRGRAKLVGEKSFGKGSVQTLFDLADGSGVYVTIARYYTPSGKIIDHIGLQPDIKVSGEPTRDHAKDRQLQKALALLRQQLALRTSCGRS